MAPIEAYTHLGMLRLVVLMLVCAAAFGPLMVNPKRWLAALAGLSAVFAVMLVTSLLLLPRAPAITLAPWIDILQLAIHPLLLACALRGVGQRAVKPRTARLMVVLPVAVSFCTILAHADFRIYAQLLSGIAIVYLLVFKRLEQRKTIMTTDKHSNNDR